MTDPKWLAKAEKFRRENTPDCYICTEGEGTCGACLDWDKRLALALEEAHAAGKAEGMEMVEKLSKKLAEARDRGYNEGPFL